MSSNFLNDENKGDIVIYQSESGETKIDVRFQDETVWLTQAQLCELYQSSKANVSEHIKNIFEEGELEQSAVVSRIRLGFSLYCSMLSGCSENPNNCRRRENLCRKPL